MSAPLEALLVEQIPRLRRYARALAGDAAAADDLVQDCLERACRKGHQWRAGSDLRAWLFTIMHNCHVTGVRRAIRRGHHEPLEESTMPGRDGGQESALAVRDLGAGLAELPPEQREVLLLVALEGLRYEEVASVLDIPLGTVMSRLFRARERMRRWMAGEGPVTLRRVK